jgi:hypothetical protein
MISPSRVRFPEEFQMTKYRVLVASAALLFAVGSLETTASAGTKIRCSGGNSCKGTSACKTAQSSCKGRNSCKGLGWSETATENECTTKGGKVL